MPKEQLIKKWQEIGEHWMKGELEGIDFGKGKPIMFSDNQRKFINSKKRFCLYSGGFGCGKTLPLLIKASLFCLCFPGTRVLLGRQYLSDIEKGLLPDLFELLPPSYYKHRVKEGIIRFFNESEIILFGLDALRSGSQSDIKKAQQKIKSLNLAAYCIDQLEEIEFDVFEALNARLRRMDVPFQQGNMTCNPANYWAYDFFKVNPSKRDDVCLVEGSMLDNKENVPPEYIEEQLNHNENYVKRYVYGIWSPDVIIEKCVFDPLHIKKFELLVREPVAVEQGCEIWEQPQINRKYQMGIDPSEGAVDPSSISVVSDEGKKVAKFNGLVPIPALGAKAKFLYEKYNRPLIIPEVNAAGMALLEYIRDFKVYQRIVFDYKYKQETKKIGWKTSHASKQLLISNFEGLLKKDLLKVYDKQTVQEMKTFVYSDIARQKGAGAERGFHDDDVISTLLAFYGLKILKSDSEEAHLRAIRERLKGQTIIESPI